MNFRTLIIGERSNLSQKLNIKLKNSEIISTEIILKSKSRLKKIEKYQKINLIINSFYPSAKLTKSIDYKMFVEKSLLTLTKIINSFEPEKINKIIYTSSASVYNLYNKSNLYGDKLSNREIYSIAKFLSEKILIDFSDKNKINLTLARLFNIYGGSDNFSILSKIIESYSENKNLVINNNGNSIRDFIHVDEVCEIYRKLLKSKFKDKLICDIGKGYGYKINDIISLIGKKNLKIKRNFLSEQDVSIANYNLIRKNKIDLGNYIKKKLKLKNKKKLKKIFLNINNNLINKEINGSIIYGAGNAGKQVCDLLLTKNPNGVFCFVDDDRKKIGKFYRDKIIISKEDLKVLSIKKKIPNIIIAIPSMTNEKLTNLFNDLNKISSSVNNIPLKTEFNTDRINLNDLQNSQFLHIFNKKNNKILNNYYKKLKNKNILVTGAGGSIGSELVIQLARFVKKKIICLDFSELFLFNLKNKIGLNNNNIKFVLGDINDNFLMKNLIKENKIDIIFHAAAYKHLNFLEQNSNQAIKNNIIGTFNLINAAKLSTNKNITMINISTDKAVRATSILGLSKRISEIICQNFRFEQNSNIKISTVRFGNVFGSMGSAVNLFLDKINKGENINLTDRRATRFFMSINEACNLVIAASQLNKSFKTLILDMGKPVNIGNLLKKMIQLKTFVNKDFEIKVKETGLNKGEKLVEELSINKKVRKTKIDRILEVNEPSYSLKETNDLISNIKKMIDTKKHYRLIPELRKFLKKEL